MWCIVRGSRVDGIFCIYAPPHKFKLRFIVAVEVTGNMYTKCDCHEEVAEVYIKIHQIGRALAEFEL